MTPFLSILTLILISSANAAEILKVGGTGQFIAVGGTELTYKSGDGVCVYADRSRLECGEVIKAQKNGIIVKLRSASLRIQKGMKVRVEISKMAMAERKTRKPAAKLMSTLEVNEGISSANWNLTGGMTASLSFFFPMLHFQRRIKTHFSIGIEPLYFKATAAAGTMVGYGGLLTFSYYGNEYFRGFWAQVAAGVHHYAVETITLTGTVPESATPFVGLATVGWRGYWDLGFNIGVAGGIQYVTDPAFAAADLKGVGFQPVVLLDVGISF